MLALNAVLIVFAALGLATAHADVPAVSVNAPQTSVNLGAATTVVPPTRPQPCHTEPTSASISLAVEQAEPLLAAAPPETTPAPEPELADFDNVRFRLTTYTSCVTWNPGYVHCGVHVPVLDVNGSGLGRFYAPGTATRAALVAGALMLALAFA